MRQVAGIGIERKTLADIVLLMVSSIPCFPAYPELPSAFLVVSVHGSRRYVYTAESFADQIAFFLQQTG
ncbi:hypothetical protein [Edaphovirga cremea]|uniref:hypothetical protein n=1 Tax=Edaphovirga cremea TaxID=2267246 RepID=UPI003988C41D